MADAAGVGDGVSLGVGVGVGLGLCVGVGLGVGDADGAAGVGVQAVSIVSAMTPTRAERRAGAMAVPFTESERTSRGVLEPFSTVGPPRSRTSPGSGATIGQRLAPDRSGLGSSACSTMT